MWVTIYTDASFCPHSKRGRFAFWVKSEIGRLKGAGNCPSYIEDNNVSEAYAIVKGIETVLSSWKNVEGVLVCSDSQTALSLCWPWTKKHRRVDFRNVQNRIIELRDKVEVRTKKVKGHSKNKSVEAYLNCWCDKASKVEQDFILEVENFEN